MKLNLKRPIVFFDLETTGISVSKDRIVEISIIKVFPDAHEEVRTYRVNPEMPIPPESTAIHGISDADTSGLISLSQISWFIAGLGFWRHSRR